MNIDDTFSETSLMQLDVLEYLELLDEMVTSQILSYVVFGALLPIYALPHHL
jgi:hypothetical protein